MGISTQAAGSTPHSVVADLRDWVWNGKTTIILRQIYRRQQIRRQAIARQFEIDVGATHRQMSLGQSLTYVRQVFDDYLQYGALSPEDLQGKRVLEIGPGDNLGVGLLFVASGADSVVALDRFYSERDPEHQKRIYQELRRSLSEPQKQRFDGAVSLEPRPIFHAPRLQYVFGHGLEEATGVLGRARFDLIVSRAVLEEIHDIDQAFLAMDKLLVPGGTMLHKIDLRDYNIFSRLGLHPLTFLTIPDFVYDLMARDVGKPNRRLADYYRQKISQLGYRSSVLITHVLGRSEELIPHRKELRFGEDYSNETLAHLASIRPKLLDRYQLLTDLDLMTTGIFLVAQKPR